MKKIILIDGNNFMFRSFYATINSGRMMKTKDGFATNALYGFVTMINKIIKEENPEYMLVAFDIGKNFRHEAYDEYKSGRRETPEDLKKQMPVAKELLSAMGIKYLEKEGFEADDIIGTVSKMCDEDKNYDGLIISSDRDLLQLITKNVNMKMLKSKDNILYNEETFKEDYGFEPIKIIDLKALMGDTSDNIKGVAGIGEKTAQKLIKEYGSLDGVYQNLDNLTAKLKEKLTLGKEDAYFSYKLATIYKEIPLDITLEDLKYNGPTRELNELYKKLEFYSLIDITSEKVNYKQINDIKDLPNSLEYSYYIECDNENYHFANILGMGLYDGNNLYYIDNTLIKDVLLKVYPYLRYTYDLKKNIVLCNDLDINLINSDYDASIVYYLLDSNSTDLSSMMKKKGISCYTSKELFDKKVVEDDLPMGIASKAKFIWDEKENLLKNLKENELTNLYNDIEMPLVRVLADMELTGIRLDETVLIALREIVKEKLDSITSEIYSYTGEFNISSPKQLKEVLFDKLKIEYPKRNAKALSTDISILNKIKDKSPVVPLVIEYRLLNKLLTSYLEPLGNYKKEDGKVHTVFKQTLTRTGRLSSAYPNLQNIPTRIDEAKLVKKAFVAEENSIFLSADYSQIELRILCQLSGDKVMLDAFNNDEDIHRIIASKIYNKDIEEITPKERSNAKHIIFGIIYGMSDFGLSEDLNITPKEASIFIDKFYSKFEGVKDYMDNIVEKSKQDGYVKTLFNRKRYIDEYNSPVYMVRKSGERLAQNTPIQGTGADIMKLAMIDIYNQLNKNNLKSKLILQIHDEVILNVYNDEKDIVEKIVKDSMENVVKFKIPLKIGMSSGKDWFETK